MTVTLEDLIGILPDAGPPKTIAEINEAIVNAAVERGTRGLEGSCSQCPAPHDRGG